MPAQGDSMDFEDVKKSICSTDWEQIGSKYNTPDLSIFPQEIKNELKNGTYEANKKYFFEDGEHLFRIESLVKDQRLFFIISAKLNKVDVKQIKPKEKSKFKYSTKFDTKTKLIIIVLAVIVIGIGVLSGPITKALFG